MPDQDTPTSYTVTRRDGLTIAHGSLPIDVFVQMTEQAGDHDIAHPGITTALGACMVFGSRDACRAEARRLGIAEPSTPNAQSSTQQET